MKLGISTYCLRKAIDNGSMNLPDVVSWAAKTGAEHVEIVPVGVDLTGQHDLVDAIRARADKDKIELSNYCIGANFLTEDKKSLDKEIQRVKSHVDVADQLGVKLMRHDVASVPKEKTSIDRFMEDLPVLADACREVAEYASQFGITTSVENHGFYVQASDRVKMLVTMVGRDNYKTTIDVGNFLCADEKPLGGVKKNLSIASMVHLKDFYIRRPGISGGDVYPNWLQTTGGYYLRGSIFGQGDVDTFEIVKAIKSSGYEGYLSIEFEGLEDCLMATQVSFENARKMWDLA